MLGSAALLRSIQTVKSSAEIASIVRRHGNDHWIGTLAGDDPYDVEQKLTTMQVRSSRASEVFTHCYILRCDDIKDSANNLVDEFGLGLRHSRSHSAAVSGCLYLLVNVDGPTVLLKEAENLGSTDRKLSAEQRLRKTPIHFEEASLAKFSEVASAHKAKFWLTAFSGVDVDMCKKRVCTTAIEGDPVEEHFRCCYILPTDNCKDTTTRIEAAFGVGARRGAVRARHESGCVILLLKNKPASLPSSSTTIPASSSSRAPASSASLPATAGRAPAVSSEPAASSAKGMLGPHDQPPSGSVASTFSKRLAAMSTSAQTDDVGTWQVTWDGGVRIRSAPDTTSERLGASKYGQHVRARRKGSWLALVDEPGFMMMHHTDGTMFVREVAVVKREHMPAAPVQTPTQPCAPAPTTTLVPPQAKLWKVIWEGGVRIRAQPMSTAERLRGAKHGECLRAIAVGNWIHLVDEPGFMLIRAPSPECTLYLEEADESRRVTHCSSSTVMTPAATLPYTGAAAATIASEPRPVASPTSALELAEVALWHVLREGRGVRAAPIATAERLKDSGVGRRVRACMVPGGGWIALADEPGFMLVASPEGTPLLRRVDPPSSAESLCKFGCGCAVAPGTTANGNSFDTCCRQCATGAGTSGHDETCPGLVGQARPPMKRQRLGASMGATSPTSPSATSSTATKPKANTDDQEELHVKRVRLIEQRLGELLPTLPIDKLDTPFVQSQLEKCMKQAPGRLQEYRFDIARIWRGYKEETEAFGN